MSDAATDALVAARYPQEWARANSKLRTKLRKRYRDDCKLDELKAAGRSCETCEHIDTPPFGLEMYDHVCSLMSDFHGSIVVKKTDLCIDWKEATR